MNCFEFRRTYLINTVADTYQLSHVSQCKKCAQFALVLSRLNYKLSTSFEVAMPKGWNQLCQQVQQILWKRYRYRLYCWVFAILFLSTAGVVYYYV